MHIGCTLPKIVCPLVEMCASGTGYTINLKHRMPVILTERTKEHDTPT